MSRFLGSPPTVGTFRRFYCSSINNGWLSFSKFSGVGTPCCYSNNYDSLKKWNNHFFWIDASRLNENRTLIRKYPEIFLSIVGLSRSFIDDDVRPTFLGRDKKEMSLLDFVKSVDPFKVKTGERTLAENKHPLSWETEDMVISLSRKTLHLVDHTIVDELQSVVGKRKRKSGILLLPARLLLLWESLLLREALEKCQLKSIITSLPDMLDSAVSDEGENWSGRQRQLFCLGRVLLKRNKILILDEATASIDSATDNILQRIIREEFSSCTVITVAHRVHTVIDSDKVMVLSFGEMVEYDEPFKLMETDSFFSKLVAEYWAS
ncbi:ABC transporter C family member 8-like protein, partial [Tanacetum coccineum]